LWEEKNAKFLGCFVEFGFDWSSIHGTIFLLLDSSLTREASSKFLSHFKYNNFQMRERTFGKFSKASIGCFESFFSFVFEIWMQHLFRFRFENSFFWQNFFCNYHIIIIIGRFFDFFKVFASCMVFKYLQQNKCFFGHCVSVLFTFSLFLKIFREEGRAFLIILKERKS